MPWSAPKACEVCGRTSCDCRRKRKPSRPKTASRGYGSKWRAEREKYLSVFRRCAKCGAEAEVVDHITPHRGDAKLFWDRKNWQPLCTRCHNVKSGQEAHTEE